MFIHFRDVRMMFDMFAYLSPHVCIMSLLPPPGAPQVPPTCHPGATQVPPRCHRGSREHPKDRPKEKQRKEFLLGLNDISSEAIARLHQRNSVDGARTRLDYFGLWQVWPSHAKPIQELLVCRC